MITMQFTGLLSIHNLISSCFTFPLKPACFTGHENPPNKCAKITRRNDPPEKPAMATCQIHMRLKPTEFTPRKDPSFQLAACFPEIPPSLLKIPRLDPARQPSPLSPTAPPTKPGGGGREPARPTHASWTGTYTFIPHFMNGYISLYDTIHTYSTQSGLIWKYKYIAVGEGIIC